MIEVGKNEYVQRSFFSSQKRYTFFPFSCCHSKQFPPKRGSRYPYTCEISAHMSQKEVLWNDDYSISRSSKLNVIVSFHHFISQAKLEKLVISTKKQLSTSFYRFLFFVKNIQYLKIYSFVFPYSLQKPSSCCKNLLHVSPTVSPRQSF